VLHFSSNKKLIVKTKNKVNIKIPVMNDKLNQIGIIADMFGPVNNPYISIKPIIENPEQYIGHIVYALNRKARAKRR